MNNYFCCWRTKIIVVTLVTIIFFIFTTISTQKKKKYSEDSESNNRNTCGVPLGVYDANIVVSISCVAIIFIARHNFQQTSHVISFYVKFNHTEKEWRQFTTDVFILPLVTVGRSQANPEHDLSLTPQTGFFVLHLPNPRRPIVSLLSRCIQGTWQLGTGVWQLGTWGPDEHVAVGARLAV